MDGRGRRVGDRRLHLVLADDDRAEAAAGHLAALGPEVVRTGAGVALAVDSSAQASAALLALTEAGIEVQEARLALPSLDEVFRTLTGPERQGCR